jgi:uncharacterized protein (TIGR02145 family)
VLEEFEELRGDKIKFQVKADLGNIETVVIGTQEWTVKNLDVSKYRNGDIIPEVKDSKKWQELKTGAWCYYDNDPENGKIYGKLYNWYAINDPRGLAPEGFHVPSDKEWSILNDYLGYEVAGVKMKEQGKVHWNFCNESDKVDKNVKFAYGTNSSGFTALPGGYREDEDGLFYGIGYNGFWWNSSVSETRITHASGNSLYWCRDAANNIKSMNKKRGCSVRCIKD